MLSRRRLASIGLALVAWGCKGQEPDPIVHAASVADDPWNCPEDSTRVFELGGGRVTVSHT